MKKTLLILGFLILQSCGKKEGQSDDAVASPTQDSTEIMTPQEMNEADPNANLVDPNIPAEERGENNPLLGEWLAPIPGMEDQKAGFALYTEGMAESVNSSTLVYQSYSIDGDKITLSGISKGNGSESKFKETYIMKKDAAGKTIMVSEQNKNLIYTHK